MKLSDGEKLILIMLCDIYKALGIGNKGEVDAELVKAAIDGGHLWGLTWAYSLFHDHEKTDETVNETVNIMDMWSFLERGYTDLSKEEKERVAKEVGPLGENFGFSGFDGNNESSYVSVARFLTERLDRFGSFKGRDFDAHMPTLDAHRRMLRVFDPLRKNLADARLSADDIIKILKARYPERSSGAVH